VRLGLGEVDSAARADRHLAARRPRVDHDGAPRDCHNAGLHPTMFGIGLVIAAAGVA
jgi:hypothetical protein